MIFLLQEKADATPTRARIRCPLQCQASIDPFDGKVRFADPALRYGAFAEPFTQAEGAEGWAKEFTEAVFNLQEGEFIEVMVCRGFIYPVRARWWVFPAKTMVREYVYPLVSARTFKFTAIADQYYAKKELEYAQKRTIAVAQGAVTGYSAGYVAPIETTA
jgi:hypothetical protein